MKSLKPRTKMIDVKVGAPVAVERIRGNSLKAIRKRVAQRDEYTCQICGRVTVYGEIDHKTPLALGGSESDENRWYLCKQCHKLKSFREEGERGKGGPYISGKLRCK